MLKTRANRHRTRTFRLAALASAMVLAGGVATALTTATPAEASPLQNVTPYDPEGS